MALVDVIEPLLKSAPRHGFRNVAWGFVTIFCGALAVGGIVNFAVKATDGRWGDLFSIYGFIFGSTVVSLAASTQTTWGRPLAERLAARKG